VARKKKRGRPALGGGGTVRLSLCLTAETVEAVRKMAELYDWSTAQTCRNLIVRGLEDERS